MSAGTVLHIRRQGDTAARVLELTGPSVRVGRGAGCEVRLDQDGLADVQCLLRRQGRNWQVQPVGPPGRIELQGRAVEQSRSLPLGVPLRVGDAWLTLAPAEPTVIESWGEHAPTIEDPLPDDGSPAAHPSREAVVGALRGTLEQRERRLRERLEQLRRSSAQTDRFTPSARSKLPAVEPIRLSPAPETEAKVETADEFVPRREPELGQAAIEPQPEPESSLPASEPVALPSAIAVKPEPATELSRSVEAETIDPEPPLEPASKPFAKAEDLPDSIDLQPIAPRPTIEIQWSIPRPDPLGSTPARTIETSSSASDEDRARGFVFLNPPPPARTRTTRPSTKIQEPALPLAEEKRVEIRDDEPRSSLSPDAPRERSEDRREAIDEDDLRDYWPTAAAILEAHQARRSTAAELGRKIFAKTKATASFADETDPLTIPEPPPGLTLRKSAFAIVWSIALLTTGALGCALTGLAWIWAIDDAEAGKDLARVTNAATELSAEEAAERVEASTVDPRWWKTSADRLFLRAILVDRAGGAVPSGETTASLLSEARAVSPAHPGVRLAIAAAPEATSRPVEALGLSRDIISLGFAAKATLKAGRRDAAWNLARQAVEIALRADPADLPPPAFLEDRHYRRFTLPREESIAPLFRELFEIERPDLDRILSLSPRSALSATIWARVLLDKNDPAAQPAIEAALAIAEPDPAGDRRALAEHHAARGEAFALLEKWAEAADAYRLALDRIDDDRDRRAWSLNLADLLGRIGDDAGRATALAASKSTDPKDEITRRAVAAQRAEAGADRDPAVRRASHEPP